MNKQKGNDQGFTYYDEGLKQNVNLQIIRERQKALKQDCIKSSITIGVIIIAIIIAIFQETIFPPAQPSTKSMIPSTWTVYSDNQQIKQLLITHGYNLTSDSNSSNILWLSNQDQLEKINNDKKSQQVFNYYGRSLLSKYHLFKTLERFDLKDVYRFIQPRKFMTRMFLIPFADENNCEDYQELVRFRKYNVSNYFLIGVENNQTGRTVQQTVIQGTANFQKIYNNYKAQYSSLSSNHNLFLEKIVQTNVQLDNRPLDIYFPISVIGKNILYNETNIFAKTYASQEDIVEYLDQNPEEDNSNKDQKRVSWKVASFNEIKEILFKEDALHTMKFIISYCMEAMFDQDFPDHEGRNRYSLFMFVFKIDRTDNRVYLSRIEQNTRIKNSPNSSFNKLILNGYRHLFSNLAIALQSKVKYDSQNTLRIYKNAIESTLFIHDDESKTPSSFKTFAPLNYNFRLKKVVVYDLQNFLNFYEYFLHKEDQYMPLLKTKSQYNEYKRSADVYFAKHISKFRPYKNAQWGSESGWLSRTKYRFQMDLDLLQNQQKYKHFDINMYIPKTYFFNMSSSSYNTKSEKEFLKYMKHSEGLWIYKPSSSYGGKGIKLTNNLTEIYTYINEQKNDPKQRQVNQNEDGFSLVQKYIEKPFLIDQKKFDFRMYPMMVSVSPLVVIYLNGYIRSSLSNYTIDSLDQGIHLTNLHVQKNHPQFKQLQEKAHITMEEFENQYFLKQFSEEKLEAMYNHLKAVCAFSMEALYKGKRDTNGRFQAFGVDIMIDEQANVQLIEMNSNPYFINGTSLHINLLPKLLKNFLDISMEIQRQNDIHGQVLSTDFIEEMCPHCDILIDESKNFKYIDYFDQKTGIFNIDNPVYKNKKKPKFI